MTRFLAFTTYKRPGHHIWREGTRLRLYMEPVQQPGLPPGFHAFDCELGTDPQEKIFCLLFNWNQDDTGQTDWEQSAHAHEVPRLQANRLPPVVWLFQGSARAVAADPFSQQHDQVRIHLVTAARYRDGELFVWNAPGVARQTIPLTGHDDLGPFWDVDLSEGSRSCFQFKFRRQVGSDWSYEPDYANRLWVAQDGAEIWTHSEARDVLSARPLKRQLTVHFRQEIDAAHTPRMYPWQEGSDFDTDIKAEAEVGGWTAHRFSLYTGLPYRFIFLNPTFSEQQWENAEAVRELVIQDETERWTLEGDRHLFTAKSSQ